MKLTDFLTENVILGESLFICAPLDAGTGENFTVEIARGDRNNMTSPGWRNEYKEWLEALNLEIDHVGACKEDVNGNKDLLCIFCKPIKVAASE